MPPLGKDQMTSLLPGDSKSDNGDCVCKVKCVLVGDGAIGKTSLVVSYTTNGYPTEYEPTAFDNYLVVVNVNGQPVRLQLCDTAGQDDFDSLRPLCYPQTDIFLLCFSVVCPTSFHNITEKWLPEIKQHAVKTPILLVGTQCDLRTDVQVLIELAKDNEHPITESEAYSLMSNIGAIGYQECSALTQKNLKEVFDTALLSALKTQKPDLISLEEGRHKCRSILGKHKNKLTRLSCMEDGHHKKRGWKRFCCFL